ncbi:MAG: DUF4124 domain-containing protein [Deltaproteobacteria bacterium]|jgi:hypothetical protein|nr:DUF4124 domain-containing protein [Deltaproteobacteria bacterium]
MKAFTIAIVLMLALIVMGIPNSGAQVYTWTDENGVKHFGDAPPPDAINPKPAFQEYEHDEAADRQRSEEDAREIQKAVNEIDQEYEAATEEKTRQEEEAEANQPPTMEERIQDERTRLGLKISELESQPLEQFGSQQNKIRTIGYYKYRLADLEKDPEKYFNEPPPPLEVNVKNPDEDEKQQ